MKELNCLVFLSCVSVLTVSAESELISSQQPVEVLAGYDVILPCHLEPPINVRSETVLWSRSELKPKYVHYHQDGRLMFEHQDPSYSFRTRLFMDELMKGNVSMKIFKVKMSDAGTYICSLPSMNKEASIHLRVEESDVIGSHEPVHVTVGHDVILPCHLEPPFDVTTLTVEWKWNESIIHVYRSRREEQGKNHINRTSLFIDELTHGNISLKLINVTEQDAGNYTCFVPKLKSQVKRGFINLIVESEENRNKGNQTDSDKKKNNDNRLYGLFALIIPVAAIGFFIRRKRNRQGGAGHQPALQLVPLAGNVQPAPPAGQGGAGHPVAHQLVPLAGNVQPAPPAGQGGAGHQPPQQPGPRAGNVQPDPGAGRDGRRQHEQVKTDDSRDKGPKSGAGPDGRGQCEQVEMDDSRDEGRESGAGQDGRGQHEKVETDDSRDKGPKSGAGRDGRGQYEKVKTDDSSDEGQESGAGRDGRGQHEQVETDDSRDKGQKSGAGRDGRGQYEKVKTDDSIDEGQESGAGRDGRGQHEQVETDDSRDKGPKLGAGPDGRGQHEQIEMDDSKDKGQKSGAGRDGRGQYEKVKTDDSSDEGPKSGAG